MNYIKASFLKQISLRYHLAYDTILTEAKGVGDDV